MMSLEDLKGKKEILSNIEWDLTPQEAFERYQVKSKDSWKHRNLSETHYFYIDVWKEKAKLFLMKRGLVSAEDVAEIEIPAKLLLRCVDKHAGNPPSRGQYPIDEEIKGWLKEKLEI